MKKIGVLGISLVAIGMGVTVSAVAEQTISAKIGPQAINYKGETKSYESIVHNNTTYIPLRAMSELVGVPVDYENKVIYLGESATTPSQSVNTPNQSVAKPNVSDSVAPSVNKGYIGKDEAKKIALQHAKVQESQVTLTELKLDQDDNPVTYEVEFFQGNKEFDYEIDATTGAIISYDYDIEGFDIPTTESNETYIGENKAVEIALNHAGLTKAQVTSLEAELDEDDGRWEYSVQFEQGNKEYEYEIDAYTGKIIDFSVDND